MAMTVKKVKDSALNKVFIHKVADIRGGVSVATSELVNDYLKELLWCQHSHYGKFCQFPMA